MHQAASAARGDRDLRGTEAEGRAAHGPQPLWAQLEADQEQQHDHAELRDLRDLLGVVTRPKPEGPMATPATR